MKARYKMRTLLAIFSICAILFGWFAIKIQQARQQHRAAETIQRIGGIVYYDYQYPGAGSRINKKAQSPIPSWVRSLFGDGMFSNVTYVILDDRAITNTDLRHLTQFPHLKKLRLIGEKISEQGLSPLSELNELEDLSLGIEMTDEGLDQLARVASLKELYIMGPYRDAHNLRAQDPDRRITDYYRYDSLVTREGVEQLGEKLPYCRITY